MGLGMLGGMAAALGAGADGYSAGMDRGRKLKQEDEDRAFQADQRTRMKEQQDREKQVRDAIDKASKDFTVEPMPGEAKPTTMDNRDVGATGEQALQPGGYRAGSMTYATQGEAQAAATASAAPTARMERVAGAMERNGDAVGGMKMRNVMQQQKVGDLQLKAGELQLKQGERKEANDAWDDQSKTALRKAGPEGFAQFLTDSKGDNADGAAQFKATRSPDGKTWRIDMVGPNGELIPRTQEFTNDARGFAEAHVLFSMGVPETQKLAHYVAQQNADTQAGYRKDQADNMREQRKLQERQLNINQQLVNQKGPTAPVIEPFDTKLARDTAHDAVRAENKRRGDNNQPLMTGQEAALMADDFVNAQQVQHGNRQVLIAASNALGRVAPDSPEYAQVYARVL
ncbi:MAG: hypothetical protein IV107_16280, partial [Paucibacter sp.]|nr:hypothetical protein [Roseateles sp.]